MSRSWEPENFLMKHLWHIPVRFYVYDHQLIEKLKSLMSHGILWLFCCMDGSFGNRCALLWCAAYWTLVPAYEWAGCIASKTHGRKPCAWSRKFKRTVATSSHSSATWPPPGSGHKRPVFKYCLYNNRIFLTVQSGRLQWENQGFLVHWCSFATQIQVQGQHVLLRWDHPSGVGLRPAWQGRHKEVSLLLSGTMQGGWWHLLQMTHPRFQVDHMTTGWWGYVGTFRGAGVAGIWHASDGGDYIKGNWHCTIIWSWCFERWSRM